MAKHMYDDKMEEISEYGYEEWLELDIDDKYEFCRIALSEVNDYFDFELDMDVEDIVSSITESVKSGESLTVGEAVEQLKEGYEDSYDEDIDEEEEDL